MPSAIVSSTPPNSNVGYLDRDRAERSSCRSARPRRRRVVHEDRVSGCDSALRSTDTTLPPSASSRRSSCAPVGRTRGRLEPIRQPARRTRHLCRGDAGEHQDGVGSIELLDVEPPRGCAAASSGVPPTRVTPLSGRQPCRQLGERRRGAGTERLTGSRPVPIAGGIPVHSASMFGCRKRSGCVGDLGRDDLGDLSRQSDCGPFGYITAPSAPSTSRGNVDLDRRQTGRGNRRIRRFFMTALWSIVRLSGRLDDRPAAPPRPPARTRRAATGVGRRNRCRR